MISKLRYALVLCLLTAPCFGQLWSGILDPTRAPVTWPNAGVTGGIPTNRTIACATISPFGSNGTGVLTTVGTAVTRVSGTNFNVAWVNAYVHITPTDGNTSDNDTYQISAVADASHMTLTSTAGSHTNSNFVGAGSLPATPINSAIASCASGQYVSLSAGSYYLASGVTFAGRSDVTLRGLGADQTFLVFIHDDSCQGQSAVLCIPGNGLGYYGPGPPSHIVNWTAGYAQGTTAITLSATTGLSVGMYIMVDGCNTGLSASGCGGSEGINSNDMVNCQLINTCTTESGGATPQRPQRAQRDFFKVTNIAGNVVTLDHGIRQPNWAALAALGTGTTQAWWGSSTDYSSGDGIEDLSADSSASGAGAANITLIFTHDSWVSGVRTLYGPNPRAHVLLYQTAHVTVQNSYSYGSVSEGAGPTHYGVEEFPGYDDLIQNNIFQRRTSPYVMDGAVGTVVAYNFVVNDQYSVSPTFMQASFYSHEGGNWGILWEGNIGPGYKSDVVHASSNMPTTFRNRFIGWEPNKTSETGAAKVYALQRFQNHIGNVTGKSDYFTSYEGSSGTCPNLSVWGFGCGGPITDTFTYTSAMRWGNVSCFSGSCDSGRFVSGEVPSGIANYANAVPASHSLPSSFYLSSKPSWFGTLPWPGIGPDITGGSIDATNGTATWVAQPLGGFANLNSAQNCWENVMSGTADGSGGPFSFNAAACYSAVPNSPSVNVQGQIKMSGTVVLK